MKTDFNFLFTEKAQKALLSKGKQRLSFPTPANMPVFLPGDLVTFGQLDSELMFKVRSRYFIWQADNYLKIQYVLSLPSETLRSSASSYVSSSMDEKAHKSV